MTVTSIAEPHAQTPRHARLTPGEATPRPFEMPDVFAAAWIHFTEEPLHGDLVDITADVLPGGTYLLDTEREQPYWVRVLDAHDAIGGTWVWFTPDAAVFVPLGAYRWVLPSVEAMRVRIAAASAGSAVAA